MGDSAYPEEELEELLLRRELVAEACCWIGVLAGAGVWAAWADGDAFDSFGDNLDDEADTFDAAECARKATNKFAKKGLLVGIFFLFFSFSFALLLLLLLLFFGQFVLSGLHGTGVKQLRSIY